MFIVIKLLKQSIHISTIGRERHIYSIGMYFDDQRRIQYYVYLVLVLVVYTITNMATITSYKIPYIKR